MKTITFDSKLKMVINKKMLNKSKSDNLSANEILADDRCKVLCICNEKDLYKCAKYGDALGYHTLTIDENTTSPATPSPEIFEDLEQLLAYYTNEELEANAQDHIPQYDRMVIISPSMHWLKGLKDEDELIIKKAILGKILEMHFIDDNMLFANQEKWDVIMKMHAASVMEETND